MSCYRLIDTEKAHHSVSRLARTLGVSRAGYYAWARRGPSRRAVEDAHLTERIRHFHQRSRGSYGAPRLHVDLRDFDGTRISRKRVARLMRSAGLTGVHRRRRHGLTRRDPHAQPAPDLVERAFTAPAPDLVWTADIKYIPTSEGWLYLAVVLDACSRRAVGWAMAEHLRTDLVLDALNLAVAWRRPKPGLVHHSDQGCQYTSLRFGRRCQELGIRPSMGKVGTCYDNAVTESFFATLQCELLDQHRPFPTRLDARMAVFAWIQGWYNPRRRHSTLGYRSPLDHEAALTTTPPVPTSLPTPSTPPLTLSKP